MEPRTCIEAEPYALQVTDESMSPEFPRGCVIIVDPTGVVGDGAFVLAEHDGALVFRRLRVDSDDLWLEALSPNIPVIRPPNGLSAIRGVVVQRAGRRRRESKRYG
ncbi:MAG TPA: S24 family peptidase [Gammaproteobacteria bacterium]|nr:S24 family peptidase [Gammaproteobacteria bacterium]